MTSVPPSQQTQSETDQWTNEAGISSPSSRETFDSSVEEKVEISITRGNSALPYSILDYNDDQFSDIGIIRSGSQEELPGLQEEMQNGSAHDSEDVYFESAALDQFPEYDSSLGQRLYELVEDFTGLSRIIYIQQWVTTIYGIDDAQTKEITNLLLGFSVWRLRSWLPWMKGKRWTGCSLLLFLQFYAYWIEHSQLWEASFWDFHLGLHRPVWNRSNLSRDDQYDLIQKRINFAPDKVIDMGWFNQWESLSLWRYGFRAFADFALLRAGLKDNENWRSLITWQASNEFSENGSQSANANLGDYVKDRFHSPAMVSWFARQDWYDHNEWHDGLGW